MINEKIKRSSEYRKENNYDVFFETYITPFCKKCMENLS